MPGRQGANIAVPGVRLGHAAEQPEPRLPQRARRARDLAGGQQGLDLRSQQHAIVRLRPVQRLDAVGVARGKGAPRHAVPDDQGEHAAQARQHRRPFLREQGQQHFGIRTGAEHNPLGRQLAAQFPEVVDFAVEDDDVAPAGRAHRLVGPLVEIENRQAAMAQPDPGFLPDALGIGAAAVHAVDHHLDRVVTPTMQSAPLEQRPQLFRTWNNR